jgi:membrane-associated phospholipid phosphatase
LHLVRLFIPIALATYLSVRYLDRQVSIFIQNSLYRNRDWSSLTSDLPDLLLLFVVITSLAAYLGHHYLNRRQTLHTSQLLRLIALSLPVAYLFKSALKFAFGRVETRVWLQSPQLYEFRWLAGENGFNGFPSGHMLVFTTLFAAIARYHAGYRPFCYGLLAALALALVATNYHFVSDVLCGTYTGFLLESGMAWACLRKENAASPDESLM